MLSDISSSEGMETLSESILIISGENASNTTVTESPADKFSINFVELKVLFPATVNVTGTWLAV